MRYLNIATILGLSVAVASISRGQDAPQAAPAFFGGINAQAWFSDPAIRKQLGLTDQQFQQLSKAYKQGLDTFTKGLDSLGKNGGQKFDDLNKLSQQFHEGLAKAAGNVLQGNQLQQFNQFASKSGLGASGNLSAQGALKGSLNAQPGGVGASGNVSGQAALKGSLNAQPSGVWASGNVSAQAALKGSLNAQPFLGGIAAQPWFSDPAIRNQLNLTDQQFQQLSKAYSRGWDNFTKGVEGLGKNAGQGLDNLGKAAGQGLGDITKLGQQFHDSLAKTAGNVLQGEQLNRFNELGLQNRGLGAFSDPAIQKKLNLNDEQRLMLGKMGENFNQSMGDLFKGQPGNQQDLAKRFGDLRQQSAGKIKSILSPQQQTAFQQMTGQPFNFNMNVMQPNMAQQGGRPQKSPADMPGQQGQPMQMKDILSKAQANAMRGFGGGGMMGGMMGGGIGGGAMGGMPSGGGFANPWLPGASGMPGMQNSWSPGAAGGYGGSPFGGGYGIQIPAAGFFLMGSAEVLKAYGAVITSDEQARLLRAQYEQARIDTAKKRFEYQQYVAANTPTFTDEQAKISQNIVRRVQTNATPAEIWSGESLNILLANLRRAPAKIKLVSEPIPVGDEVLRHLNVTTKPGFGNLGVLRNDGRFSWPPALQDLLPQKQREEMEVQAQALVQKALNGNPPNLLNDFQSAIEDAGARLVKKVNEVPTTQYLEAKRFLNDLDAARRALQIGDAVPYFQFQKWIDSDKTVQQVVEYLTARGLSIAPAVQGDEAAYQAMRTALASYDVALNLPMQ